MRFWVGFSDKMTTSEIRKNVNKPKCECLRALAVEISGFNIAHSKYR